MSKRTLKAILVVSLAFNLAVIATVAVGLAVRDSGTSGQSISDRETPIDDHGKQLSQCIGLSGEQAKCFEDVMAETSEEASKIKTELEKERKALFHLLQAKEPDEQAIMARVESISVLQRKADSKENRAVLEPEEDARLLYMIRCSMSPGCVGKEKCLYKTKKEGSE